jgi:hypothetical protein
MQGSLHAHNWNLWGGLIKLLVAVLSLVHANFATVAVCVDCDILFLQVFSVVVHSFCECCSCAALGGQAAHALTHTLSLSHTHTHIHMYTHKHR